MKVIGIVSRAYYNKDNQEIFQLYEKVRRVLSKYEDVIFIGLLPLENIDYLKINFGDDNIDTNKMENLLSMCDGFIVPGGSNFYCFDNYVIEYAIKNNKPLLGICLGFQCLCMYDAKNRTNFNMNSKMSDNYHYGKPDEYKHSININRNSLLYGIIGKDNIMVNSVHHHTVKFKMNNLVVSAVSDDNIIEAVEYPNKKFIIGVQWHPEYILDEHSKKLFDTFIKSTYN